MYKQLNYFFLSFPIPLRATRNSRVYVCEGSRRKKLNRSGVDRNTAARALAVLEAA